MNYQQWSLKHVTTYFSTNILLLVVFLSCLGILFLCLVSIFLVNICTYSSFSPTFRPISHSHCGMCYFVLLLPAPVLPTSSHFIVVLTAPTITDCRGKVPTPAGIRGFLWSWELRRFTFKEISLNCTGRSFISVVYYAGLTWGET